MNSELGAILQKKGRVKYSDFVKCSDVKEDAIEIPRIFVEIRDAHHSLKSPACSCVSTTLPARHLDELGASDFYLYINPSCA
jgi:hypothetical protein